MAKPGSAFSAARNASAASSYQKLWRAATPRRKSASAAAPPEVGKRTEPSPADPAGSAPSRSARGTSRAAPARAATSSTPAAAGRATRARFFSLTAISFRGFPPIRREPTTHRSGSVPIWPRVAIGSAPPSNSASAGRSRARPRKSGARPNRDTAAVHWHLLFFHPPAKLFAFWRFGRNAASRDQPQKIPPAAGSSPPVSIASRKE